MDIFFGQKSDSVGSQVHMFESMSHVLVSITVRWGVFTGVHMHFARRHHHVGDLVWKGKLIKWN